MNEIMKAKTQQIKKNTARLKAINQAMNGRKFDPPAADIGIGNGGIKCNLDKHTLAEAIPSVARGLGNDIADALKFRLLNAGDVYPTSDQIPDFTNPRDQLIFNRIMGTKYPTNYPADSDGFPIDMSKNECIIANAYLNRFISNEDKAVYNHMVSMAKGLFRSFFDYRFFAERASWTGQTDDFYRFVREARQTGWFEMSPPTEDEIRVCGQFNQVVVVTPASPGDTVSTEDKEEMESETKDNMQVLSAALGQMLNLHIEPKGKPKTVKEFTITDDMLIEVVDKTCDELGFSITALATAIGGIAKGAIGPIFAGLSTIGANLFKDFIAKDPGRVLSFLDNTPLKFILDGAIVSSDVIRTILNIFNGSADDLYEAIDSGNEKKRDEAVDRLFKELSEVAKGLDPKQIEGFLNKIEDKKHTAKLDDDRLPYYEMNGKKYARRPIYGSDGKLKGYLPNLDSHGDPIPYVEPNKKPKEETTDDKSNLVPIYENGEIVGYTRVKPTAPAKKEEVIQLPPPPSEAPGAEKVDHAEYVDPAEISQMSVTEAAALVEALTEHFPELRVTPPESIQKDHELIPSILDPNVNKPVSVKPGFTAGTKQNEILKQAKEEGLTVVENNGLSNITHQIYPGLLEICPWVTAVCDIAAANGLSLVVDPLGITRSEDGKEFTICGLQFAAFYNGNLNHLKSFSVDMGQILDRRVKIFFNASANGFHPLYTCETAWRLLTLDNKNLEVEFLNKIFSLGFEGLSETDQRTFRMYNSNTLQLNRVIEHVTIPTDKVKKEHRQVLKDAAFKTMRFIKDLQLANNMNLGWFHVDKFERDTLTMTLSNHGTDILGTSVPGMLLTVTPIFKGKKPSLDEKGKVMANITIGWVDNVCPEGFRIPDDKSGTEEVITPPVTDDEDGEKPKILNGEVNVESLQNNNEGEKPSFCVV